MYFPCVTIRESECRAIDALAEPTKDRLFPIVRLQAWPREKAGAGDPIERSLAQIEQAFGSRPFALDLARPRGDLATSWALAGQRAVETLHSPRNGFDAWCSLVEGNMNATPVVLWSDDADALRRQVERLSRLGRGVAFRLRRSEAWNLTHLASLQEVDLDQSAILFVLDYEQIDPREDLTLAGLNVQNAILAALALRPGREKSFVFAASSFPSQFASINPEHAVIELRERILFDMLRRSPRLLNAGIALEYGDHGSVFAADREPAFRGAPRVDYPTRNRWIYHRCTAGFDVAVSRVRHDPAWDDQLLCWGAQRIREAAAGNLTGLNSQGPWVTIRINIHLHIQAHYDEGNQSPIEEEWVD